MRTSDKARAFGCKILYFTPSSDHELTPFDATDLHYSQTGFHSTDRRLVGNTNHLQISIPIPPFKL